VIVSSEATLPIAGATRNGTTKPLRYRAYGLTVASVVEPPLPPAPEPVGPADLGLRRGADAQVPGEDPPGRLLARLHRSDDTLLYALARDGDRTVLRYPGIRLPPPRLTLGVSTPR